MRARWLLLSALLLARPALAAEAFVPFVAPEPPGFGAGRSIAVSFEVVNLGAVPRLGSVHFVASGEDGTAGGTDLLTLRMAPGRSFLRTCCQDTSGLLVFSGAPQLAVEVSLTETFGQPPPNALAQRLPLVTAGDALPAGSRGILPTLRGDGAGVGLSSFGILNLGHQPAHCSVSGFPPYVQQLFQAVVIPPVSVAAYPDLFGRPTLGAQGTPVVTCDQPFYPFAIVYAGLLGSSFSFILPTVDFVPPVVTLGNLR
jgi:hypothetical protein